MRPRPQSDSAAPRVEPEVAFLLREPLRGPGVSVADVRAATRGGGRRAGDRGQPDRRLEADAARQPSPTTPARARGYWSWASGCRSATDVDLVQARASLRLNGTEVDSGLGFGPFSAIRRRRWPGWPMRWHRSEPRSFPGSSSCPDPSPPPAFVTRVIARRPPSAAWAPLSLTIT